MKIMNLTEININILIIFIRFFKMFFISETLYLEGAKISLRDY